MKTQVQKTLYISLLLITSLCFSQTKISGKVEYRNKGVKEVNVTLKDTYDGATTDANGNYSFETTEKGNHILVFSSPNYSDVEKPIEISEVSLTIDVVIKERISEIDAVVISAGSIEASDKKRATALLTPIDIYTTAGSDGQISSALNYLPGVQKVGESEGLFIRGGSGTESKIFMDGALINNYFTSSVPGIAGRDRFNTSLFKGNIFSSGGYSAIYGQALSGILILESIDFPEQTSYDIGVSPLFVSGSYQKLNAEKNFSFGGGISYSNLELMKKLLNFNTDFTKAPQGFGIDFNLRAKTKSGGMLKYYGSFDTNLMEVKNESLEDDFQFTKFNNKGSNTFHNLSFKQKFGKYLLNLSSSYSYNQTDLNVDYESATNSEPAFNLKNKSNYFNFKSMVERKIGIISAVRGGIETNYANENSESQYFNGDYKDLITSVFAETDLGFSNHLSAKIGVRAENSSILDKWNFAPRLALAYRLDKNWTSSVAYGIFYQNPESRYYYPEANLGFQKAEHYIFQLQKNSEGRSLRLEAFIKNYDDLVKTVGDQNYQYAVNNNGFGDAKGIEFFWRDKKTFKNIDYWLSYSFLDTQRNYLNFPVSLTPNFAAKHTFSAVAKKFVTDWKTGFNFSYTFASGRPYYDIVSQNGDNIIRNSGRIKDYNSLNFSVNYLPNLGKKDSKAFTVLVLSISNILGSKNGYGYNFSQNGMRSSALVPPVNTFVFVGAFISFGIDRTEDAINNNL